MVLRMGNPASWTSYPKIYNVGHPAVKDLLLVPVRIEEKVDGSQFSFCRNGGDLLVRSRGRQFDINAPDDLFRSACETVKGLADRLHNGWTYRGEVLKGPRHNTLTYGRAPNGNVILFDIATGDQEYAARDVVESEAERLGLEVVPCYMAGGSIVSRDDLDEFMERESILGGRIEGVVFKQVDQQLYGADGKPLMAKHVSEAFKETHTKAWRKEHPTKGDIADRLADAFMSKMRWEKAVQHLRDSGELKHTPQDIGPLLRELHADADAEIADEAKEMLWQHYRKNLLRAISRGFPEWYKERLLDAQLGE